MMKMPVGTEITKADGSVEVTTTVVEMGEAPAEVSCGGMTETECYGTYMFNGEIVNVKFSLESLNSLYEE